MKKLLFAIAGAASFAALAADPAARSGDISLVGFENYNADQTVVGYGDDGNSGNTLWSCQGEDASLVKTYGGDNATAPSITEPAPFADATDPNAKYLALDTNGSELQRAIPAAGQAIAADGTYIDTLVQFTPSESDPTSADLTGAKLAIWLKADSEHNTTNLCVAGGSYVGAELEDGIPTAAPAVVPKTYKLSGTYEPSTWYRLTVKAIKFVTAGESVYAGFQIMIDGTPLTTDTAAYDALAMTAFGFLQGADTTLLTGNLLVPSADAGLADDTLTSVGFKGTGALDDFVVTTVAPDFPPPAIDFSLTWPAGYTPVSYTINGGEAVSLEGKPSPFSVPGLVGGESVVFTFRNADGVEKSMPPVTAADEGAIDASTATYVWADYLGAAVDGAYEIDNLAELKLFQKGVANTNELTTANTTFKLTANITLDAPWPGIGLQNGKDVYNTQQFNDEAFLGTFDGQNYTISGFQMIGKGDNAEGLDYCGFFNSTYGATIQNLKIAYAGSLFAADTTASTKESGATFVGVAKNSTLRNLTTVAGTVACSKGFGGIVGYLAGTTVDSCTNNVNMTSLANNKCGGIAMICQVGGCALLNCQNNGTVTTGSGEFGGIIGYTDSIVISNCQNTAAYKMFYHHGGTVTNASLKGNATVDSYTGNATPGLNFATVDGSVATFVADEALAAGNTYKVMHTATATYEFAAAGSISFDTNLIQAVTFAITAPGLDLTEATESGVVTFTAAAQGGDDYVVEIEGSDVVITPSAEDLAAVQAAVIAGGGTLDVTDVAAVNAAMAAPIGTTGVPSWQAIFLGLPPTEAGLESFKIDSISIGADGKVTVALPASVDPKTGRGVTITLKLKAADTPNAVDWTDVESASGTTFAPFAPGSTDTKKFYKVVVDFAGSSAQN